MADREIKFKVSATDEASAVFERERRAMKALREEAERRSKIGLLGRIGEDLKGVKRGGQAEGIEELAKTLRGAGAVGGIALLTSALAQATAKAVELKDQFKAGKISIGEMLDELVATIPVIGQGWQLGRNFREILTGEVAEARKLTDAFESGVKAMDALVVKSAALREEIAAAQKMLPLRLALSGAGPAEAGVIKAVQGFYAQQDEIRKKYLAVADSDEANAARRQIAVKRGLIAALRSDIRGLDVSDDADEIAKKEAQVREIQGDLAQLQGQLKRTVGDAKALKDANDANNRVMSNSAAIVDGLSGAFKSLGVAIDNPTTMLGGLVARFQQLAAPAIKFTQDWTEDVKALGEEAKKLKTSLQTPLQNFQEELRKLDRMKVLGLISPDESAAAGFKAGQALADAYRQEIEAGIKPALEWLRDTARALPAAFGPDTGAIRAARDELERVRAAVGSPFVGATAPTISSPFLTGQAASSRERVNEKILSQLEAALKKYEELVNGQGTIGGDIKKLVGFFENAPKGLLGLFGGGTD